MLHVYYNATNNKNTASYSFSVTSLSVPAEAAHNIVPKQLAAIVIVSTGPPAHKNPAPVVTTTSELKRNLLSSAYALIFCFTDKFFFFETSYCAGKSLAPFVEHKRIY